MHVCVPRHGTTYAALHRAISRAIAQQIAWPHVDADGRLLDAPDVAAAAPDGQSRFAFHIQRVGRLCELSDALPADGDGPLDLGSAAVVGCAWTSAAASLYTRTTKVARELRSHADHSDVPQERTLAECLKQFSEPERLTEDNKWYCAQCKEFVQGTKTIALWRVPPVLVVHLKRFQFNTYFRDKITLPIAFPIADLDMRPYVHGPADSSLVYDLCAVSVRRGPARCRVFSAGLMRGVACRTIPAAWRAATTRPTVCATARGCSSTTRRSAR